MVDRESDHKFEVLRRKAEELVGASNTGYTRESGDVIVGVIK